MWVKSTAGCVSLVPPYSIAVGDAGISGIVLVANVSGAGSQLLVGAIGIMIVVNGAVVDQRTHIGAGALQ